MNFLRKEDVVLEDLIVDDEINPRDDLDWDQVAVYATVLDELPEIDVFEIEGVGLLLACGFHRVEAARSVGRETLPANVFRGTVEDAKEKAFISNVTHGVPYTPEERKRGMERFIVQKIEDMVNNGDRGAYVTDEEMARRLNVLPSVVREQRQELEQAGVIPRVDMLLDAPVNGGGGGAYPFNDRETLARRRKVTTQERMLPCMMCDYYLSVRAHTLAFAQNKESRHTVYMCTRCHEQFDILVDAKKGRRSAVIYAEHLIKCHREDHKNDEVGRVFNRVQAMASKAYEIETWLIENVQRKERHYKRHVNGEG